MFSKAKKAFTIVELVIVIAVIAILMGIMFVGGTAISNNAKQSTLTSDFRTFETNIKAMINDPDATVIKTTADDTGLAPASIQTLMDKYFEGDLELGAFEEGVIADAAVTRSINEAALTMKDPYGMPYKLVILDDSDAQHTDLTFLVYSYGKNKQTATTPAKGSFDADDVGFFVQVYDSVVYTGDIGPDFAGTNGANAGEGKAYKTAVDQTSPAT